MKFCPECGNRLVAAYRDGADRLVCSEGGCNYIAWNNPVPVVAALVRRNDEYLLARNSQWPSGMFALVAGYLECAEQVQEAVLREVREELGLEGRIERFIGHYMFKKKNQLIMAFEVHASGSIQTNEEIAELKALSADELKVYDFAPFYITQQIIEDWSAW